MKKKVWITVALAVVVVAIVVAAIFVLNKDKTDDNPQQDPELNRVGNAAVGEGTVLPDDDWLGEVPNGDIGDNLYVFNMWETTWRFKDGNSPSYDATVVNDSQNSNPVYLELIFPDTEEVLFVSDYMEPGDAIHDIELGKSLEKGEYDCTLVYHLMDQEKKEEVDTVRLAITVVIEN